MPAPSVIPGVVAAMRAKLKWLEFDAQQNGSGDGVITFNELLIDEWYPQTGIDAGYEFVVPVSGNYEMYLYGEMPGYAAPGIGWPNGWSGEGGGAIWLRTLRGAGILEDNIDRQDWSSASPENTTPLDCGAVRALLAGDKITARFSGGATGIGPSLYNVKLYMTKLKA